MITPGSNPTGTATPTDYTDEQRTTDEQARASIVRHLLAVFEHVLDGEELDPSTAQWAGPIRTMLAAGGSFQASACALLQWLISPTHTVRPGENGTLTQWLMARALVPNVARDDLAAFLAYAREWKRSGTGWHRIGELERELEQERRGVRAEQLANEELKRLLEDVRRERDDIEQERQRLVAAAAEFDDDVGGLVFDEPEAIDPPVPITGMATAGTTADGVLAQIVCSTEGVLVTLRGGMSSGWSWHGTTAELRAIIERERELTALGKRLAQLDAGLANVETKRRQLLADSADLRAELVQRCEGKTF